MTTGRIRLGSAIEAASARDPYFVPSGTTLNTQLLNFQRNKRRMAFVVDEYGDIQGLVTLEDILEEIVGEFTTDPATMMHKDVRAEADGSFRGGHDDDEEDEDLAVEFVERLAEGYEREVDGVEHQLDGHENGDDVAFENKRHHTQSEQDSTQHQIV